VNFETQPITYLKG